ncbi:MAG: hypothetical protein WBO57_13150, partial [Gammaproteobacteria bacterium]
ILLHLVPSSYLLLKLFTEITLLVNLVYLVPVMLFFLTGRYTWNVAYARFGSKIYRIFVAGNTVLLIWCPVLVGLDSLSSGSFGSDVFYFVLLGYFSIHLLFTGPTVVKINKDLADEADR